MHRWEVGERFASRRRRFARAHRGKYCNKRNRRVTAVGSPMPDQVDRAGVGGQCRARSRRAPVVSSDEERPPAATGKVSAVEDQPPCSRAACSVVVVVVAAVVDPTARRIFQTVVRHRVRSRADRPGTADGTHGYRVCRFHRKKVVAGLRLKGCGIFASSSSFQCVGLLCRAVHAWLSLMLMGVQRRPSRCNGETTFSGLRRRAVVGFVGGVWVGPFLSLWVGLREQESRWVGCKNQRGHAHSQRKRTGVVGGRSPSLSSREQPRSCRSSTARPLLCVSYAATIRREKSGVERSAESGAFVGVSGVFDEIAKGYYLRTGANRQSGTRRGGGWWPRACAIVSSMP